MRYLPSINVNNYIHFRIDDNIAYGFIVNTTIEDEYQIAIIDSDQYFKKESESFTKDFIKIPFKKNHPKFNESLEEVLKIHSVAYVVDKELYTKVLQCEEQNQVDDKNSFITVFNDNIFSIENWIEASKLFS